MEIKQILSSMVRKWWLVLLLAVLGGGIGFAMEFTSQPIYQADTTLYIVTRDVRLAEDERLRPEDLAVSQQLVRQYYDLVYSRLVISEVVKEAREYNLSANQVLSMISISNNAESNIFTISARDNDREIAAVVANAAGKAFINQISQITNSNNVSILDAAEIPRYPIESVGTKMVFLGFCTGIMLAVCIIYVMEYFDTKVRTVEDIEKGLKVRVVGIIPDYDIR